MSEFGRLAETNFSPCAPIFKITVRRTRFAELQVLISLSTVRQNSSRRTRVSRLGKEELVTLTELI